MCANVLYRQYDKCCLKAISPKKMVGYACTYIYTNVNEIAYWMYRHTTVQCI